MVRSITEIRREEITEAVLELLAEQGPRALSVQNIANQVGLAKASLYQHFSSVDEMVDASILSVQNHFMEILQRVRESISDPRERLWVFFREVSNLPTVPAALENIGRMESKSVERWLEMMLALRDDLHDEVLKEVEAAQKSGQFRTDLSSEELINLVFALYYSFKSEIFTKKGDCRLDKDQRLERLEHIWHLLSRLTDKRSEF